MLLYICIEYKQGVSAKKHTALERDNGILACVLCAVLQYDTQRITNNPVHRYRPDGNQSSLPRILYHGARSGADSNSSSTKYLYLRLRGVDRSSQAQGVVETNQGRMYVVCTAV